MTTVCRLGLLGMRLELTRSSSPSPPYSRLWLVLYSFRRHRPDRADLQESGSRGTRGLRRGSRPPELWCPCACLVQLSSRVKASSSLDRADLALTLARVACPFSSALYTPLKSRDDLPAVMYEPVTCKPPCRAILNPYWSVLGRQRARTPSMPSSFHVGLRPRTHPRPHPIRRVLTILHYRLPFLVHV